MRIDEIVIDFPLKAKKSSVIGKMPDVNLVYSDEVTGLPTVKNKKGVPYFVDKTEDGFAYPKDFDYDKIPEIEWMVIDKQTDKAISVHKTREDAILTARKLRRWKKIDATVIPT